MRYNTLLALTSLCAASASAAGTGKKPNVLFLFADDMTFEGARALGNPEIVTPNIDRLITGGTTFVNAFNQGGWVGAISVASRSMLLTGRYIWNAKAESDAKYAAPYNAGELWPQVMKAAGYRTFMTGKWHFDHYTPDKVFDTTEGVRLAGMLKAEGGYDRPKSRDDNSWLPWDISQGGFWQSDGRHWTEVQADIVINYIQANKNSSAPLFMYVAFNAPHDPRQSPKEFVDMYDVDKIKLPVNYQPEHPLKELMGCQTTQRDESLAPFPRTEYAVKKHRQEYYAIISHLDSQIGRILEALESSGMASNTIIVLAADNGLACGHHGLLGKQNMYDHSVRVPLVFEGPAIPKGEKRTGMVYMQDLVPTLYEMLGIAKPASDQFHSLLPAINDPKAGGRKVIYGGYLDGIQRMVRTDRYKLFFIPEAKTAYLFDMQNDPYEMKNLFGDKKYNAVVKQLCRDYLVEAAETGDTFDIASCYPELFAGLK